MLPHTLSPVKNISPPFSLASSLKSLCVYDILGGDGSLYELFLPREGDDK